MPRPAPFRRLAPVPDALPDSPLAAEEPPAAAPAGEAKIIQLLLEPAFPALVFRVGEYEVGAGYCPRLHGHPDIRY